MRRYIVCCILAALVCLMYSGLLQAQCSYTYSLGYGTYTNESVSQVAYNSAVVQPFDPNGGGPTSDSGTKPAGFSLASVPTANTSGPTPYFCGQYCGGGGNPPPPPPPVVVNWGNGHLIASVVVDGSASMGVQTGCPDSITTSMLNGISQIIHTGQTYNVVNGVGGWSTAPGVCASCYISYQNDVDSGLVPIGTPVTFSHGGAVYCAAAGGIPIWQIIMNAQSEIATTWSIASGPAYGCVIGTTVCFRPLAQWCLTSNYPPDFNPAWIEGTGVATPSYFIGSAFCVRPGTSGGWYCGPGVGEPLLASVPRGPCTKHP